MADLSSLIDAAGKQYNIDPALIQAVIQQESSGRPDAVNLDGGGQGAYGAMQVRQAALADFNKANGTSYTMKDLLKPDVGINVGSWYLGQQLDRFGDPTKALNAYYAGPNSDAVNAGASQYAQSVLGKMGGTSQTLPGIPQESSGPSDDDIFAAFTGGAKPASDDDAIFNSFIKPEANAAAGANTTGSVKESRAPDGTLVLEMGGTKAPADNSKEGIPTQFARGLGQGVSDLVTGLTQNWGHQSQKLLSPLDATLDQKFGTDYQKQHAAQVQGMDQKINDLEAQYQAQTPNAVAAGTGRVIGNLLPMLLNPALGSRMMDQGVQLGQRLLPSMPRLGGLLGMMGASGAQSAAYGGISPVHVQPGSNYDDALKNQVRNAAILGAAVPLVGEGVKAVGKGIGSGLRAMVDPFTEAGQQRIAQNTLARAAAGGPISANMGQIVPGSVPTLAEATGNPGIATVQRTMRDISPNDFVAREAQNAAARSSLFGSVAGSADDIARAEAARDVAAGAALKGVFGQKTAADSQPVVDAIDSILQGPSGKRDAVSQSLNNIRSKLVNAKGGLETDPEVLYNSVRKQIDDLLDKRLATSNPAGLQASRELLSVKDVLDDVITQAAPGFDSYLKAYAQASKPINAMQYLQGLNLTDANGNITLAKVQNALKGLEKDVARPGVQAAKSLASNQVAALKAIRDDLLRAGNAQLGKSVGSATAQNLATQNMLSEVLPGKLGAIAGKASPGAIGGGIGGLAGWMAAGPIGAPVGAMVGSAVGKSISGAMNSQNEAIQSALQQMLLNAQSGASALQRASALSVPAAQMNGIQRLLYPALTVTGLGALTRPPPAR